VPNVERNENIIHAPKTSTTMMNESTDNEANATVEASSAFSFLNAGAPVATTPQVETTTANTVVETKPVVENAPATTSSSSSSFSFLNSSIGGGPNNASPTKVEAAETATSIRNDGGSSLFDQLNMSTPSTTTTTTPPPPSSSSVTADLMSMSLPTPTASNLSSATSFTPAIGAATSFQKPVAKSNVTRKKKRHVKIGVGAHNNHSESTLNSAAAASSSTGGARSSSYNSELPPPAPQSQSQSQSQSSINVPENSNKVYRSESVSTLGDVDDGNNEDEIVQRAQAAAQLAQKIDVATRSTTPFFKNPFARSKKSSHSSNASTHSHGSDRSPVPPSSSAFFSSNNTISNKPPVEEVKVLPNKYSLDDAADHDPEHAATTRSYGVDKVESVSATWSSRNNGGASATESAVTAPVQDHAEPAPTPIPATPVVDPVNVPTYQPANAPRPEAITVPDYSNSAPSSEYQIPQYGDSSSPTPISTKHLPPPEKLSAMKQNLKIELNFLVQSLHSNMQQMAQCKAALRVLSGDEQLLSNKLDGLKAHMAHLVEAEEYELADVTSAQVDAIQINLSACKSELKTKMEDGKVCAARYEDITLQIQEECQSYAKSLDALVSDYNDDDSNNLEKLKEEKARLDTNLAELGVDADALKVERQELNDLILVETADLVADNAENEEKLSSVEEEIAALMAKLAEKQAEAKVFQDVIHGNNAKINAQKDKHKFKFKKLTNLEKSLESTRSEYSMIVETISEKLQAAENFQTDLDKESSNASDAISILPKLFEKIDEDSSEELDQARAAVIAAKGSLAEAELELNNMKSTKQEISVKLTEIRESIPQLQTQKGEAAKERNFKLAAGINKKLKDLQKEEDTLGDSLLENDDKIDKLCARVHDLKQNVTAEEEISKTIEADFVRVKLTKIREKIDFCEINMSEDGVLASVLEADLNHWKSVGENLCSEFSLVWSESSGDKVETEVAGGNADLPNDEPEQQEEEVSPHFAEIKALNAVDRLELYNSLSAKILEKEAALELAIEVEDYDEAAELDELIQEMKTKFEICGNLLGEDDTTEEEPGENQIEFGADADRVGDDDQEPDKTFEGQAEATVDDEDCAEAAKDDSSIEAKEVRTREDKDGDTEQQISEESCEAEAQNTDETGAKEASSNGVAEDQHNELSNMDDDASPTIEPTEDDRPDARKDHSNEVDAS